jgi:hypothetical protein
MGVVHSSGGGPTILVGEGHPPKHLTKHSKIPSVSHWIHPHVETKQMWDDAEAEQ